MDGKYFCEDPNLTKFGWFQVGDFKSFSKYESWQHLKNNNISSNDIFFNFNDDTISNINWEIEPTESIENLYAARAKQLRDTYDYIVLVYSGGIDSHVALESFLSNNIKVDEIITCYNSKLEKTSKFNQEIYNIAIPYLESLKNLDTKINLIDIGPIIENQFYDNVHLNTFLYASNGSLNAWTSALRSGHFKMLNSHHCEIARKGKSICYVWGFEKPTILLDNTSYTFRYYDFAIDVASKNYINKYIYKNELKMFTDEAFFISKEMPEINVKQCHLIINYFNKSNSLHEDLVEDRHLANTGPFVMHSSNKWLTKRKIEDIIYPRYNQNFGDDKVKGSIIFTTRDSWFFRGTSDGRNLFVSTLKKALKEYPDYFTYTIDGTPKSTTLIGSKIYKI
jgi:hypothetical protein